MAIDKFRFVSPGVQINEIDESILPEAFPSIGPVVIGTTAKGPAMQPVIVNSVAELEKVFGPPSTGRVGASDVWRTGIPTAPTFATYAAKAFLKNSNPVTVIRLAGVEKSNTDTDTPGWTVDKVHRLFGVKNGKAQLIANIYASSSHAVTLATGSTFVNAGTSSVSGPEFTIKIGTEPYNVSLDPSSNKFIRTVLNTNPTLYNPPDSSLKQGYFLGESFEWSTGSFLAEADALAQISGFTEVYLTASSVGSEFQTNEGATSGETGWIVDDLISGSLTYNKLFKFVGLTSGASLSKEIKISIENVRPSKNLNVTQYGTFDVVVRKLFESVNGSSTVLERFSNVSLDEQSDNYIARKIGDSYRKWNITTNRYEENGSYSNKSRYIRVEMAGGNISANSLPHGYEVRTMPALTGSEAGITEYTYPNISLFTDVLKKSLAKNKRFGLASDTVKNSDLLDVLSHKNFVTSGGEFTAGGVVHTRYVLENTSTTLQYDPSGYNTNDLLTAGTFSGFDMPLYGGTDGKNILVHEAFVNNEILSANPNENSNAAYRAVKRALDMVAEAESIDMNVLVVPNLKNQDLTNYMLEICRTRGDALALIDLEEDYVHAFETNDGQEVKPLGVTQVIENLQARAIDNSYGAAYFPAVFVPSEGIYMPSSIAALGALGGTEGRQALWFAPAGFNRGGLTENTSGIGVSRTAFHLISSDRDDLYAANINPIATFPNEGVVIFGQKTLQITPSALDRVNVRRLLNFIKKQISRAATRVLFEPNVEATWNSFKSVVDPFLLAIKNGYGLDDAKIVLDETTTTADLIDRNIMYCKIYIKPTRAIEYIGIDFIVTNSGAAFTEGQ